MLDISYQQYQKYEYDIIKPNLKRFFDIVKIYHIPSNTVYDTLMIDYEIFNHNEIIRLIDENM